MSQSKHRNWTGGGFELFVPPTPFAVLPKPEADGRFIMLDDEDDVFYEIDYGNPTLKNTISWQGRALHKYNDIALHLTRDQEINIHNPAWLPIAFILNILKREWVQDEELLVCVWIGAVSVKPFEPGRFSWDALESLKGEGKELPAELNAGLMRKVFDRRKTVTDNSSDHLNFVTRTAVLDNMTHKWHRDGDKLSWYLDRRFAGAKALPATQKWKVFANPDDARAAGYE